MGVIEVKKSNIGRRKLFVRTILLLTVFIMFCLSSNGVKATTKDFIFDLDGTIVQKDAEYVYTKDTQIASFEWDRGSIPPGSIDDYSQKYLYLVYYDTVVSPIGGGSTLLTPTKVESNVITFSDYVTKEGIYKCGLFAQNLVGFGDTGFLYNLIQNTKSYVSVSNGVDTEINNPNVYVLNPSTINVGRDSSDTFGDHSYSWEIKNESGTVILSGTDRNPTSSEIASLPEGKYTISNTVTETIPPEFGTDVVQDTTSGAFEIIPTSTSGNKMISDENNDGYASPNEELTYTITAKNTGTIVANNVEIKDTLIGVLPNINNGDNPSTILVNISSDKDSAKNTTISLADLIAGIKFNLAPDETITVTFKVILKANLDVSSTPSIMNTAVVGGVSTSVEIPTAEPQLIGSKSVVDADKDGFVSANEVLTYTLSYENIGLAKASNVVVTDILSDLSFTGASINNLTVNGVSSNGNIQKGINIGDLEAGGKAVITFDVKLTKNALKNSKELKNIAAAVDSFGNKLETKNTIIVKNSNNKLPAAGGNGLIILSGLGLLVGSILIIRFKLIRSLSNIEE